ncbi:MAG: prepilin peptidase, partial [Candidatus Brocadiia bacterium]|nr:prepilin peptidase [Candidatus Brocadiia bacterium]
MLLAITPREWAVTLLVFVVGCAVGSFLNVCIWRIPSGLSVTCPSRSFCPRCRTPIA